MTVAQPDFIGHVGRSIAEKLNEVLREEGLQLFRRHPQVILGAPDGLSGSDFYLQYTATTAMEGDKGSFSYMTSQDRFLVFRSPSRMTLNFTLSARGLTPAAQSRAYDRLLSFFFDHRGIDPYVPNYFRSFPPLNEKLLSGKAELRVSEMGIPTGDHFFFSFSYVALYHSGNPLREEVKAKTRVVELANESSERSVL